MKEKHLLRTVTALGVNKCDYQNTQELWIKTFSKPDNFQPVKSATGK
jgi:hypothetical protein